MKNVIKLVPVLFVSTLQADQFALQFYNDVFVGVDQHFTNGIGLSYLGDSSYSNKTYTTKGISLSQFIMTPKDITQSTPQYDDLPYAGYLALSGFIYTWDKQSFNEYRIEVGVVGEESGARAVQNRVHKIFDSRYAAGWDTQLGTQYTLNALYRHGNVSWHSSGDALSMDWFNHYGIQLGNSITDVFGGSVFRLGQNYTKNFNVQYPFLKEEASLLQTKEQKGFGWSLSSGINVDALAYSYIIDEAQAEGYNLQKNPLNATLYFGADLLYSGHKLTLFVELISPYTTNQTIPDRLGGFTYSYAFTE